MALAPRRSDAVVVLVADGPAWMTNGPRDPSDFYGVKCGRGGVDGARLCPCVPLSCGLVSSHVGR